MFRLKVIQAAHGDCLIVEYGFQADRNYILIDGGPSKVYAKHLRSELLNIRDAGGKINIAMLSHVDDDHVNGLLDLFHDLVDQRRKGQQETIAIQGLWHNSFSQTLGPALERGLARQMGEGVLLRGEMPAFGIEARSISQGDELAAYARGLKIPLNVEFKDTPDRVICLDNLEKPIRVANLNITVVGPSRSSLLALQKEWEEWLAKQKRVREMLAGEAEVVARALDMSVPNMSSIMLLVEAEGRMLLLTGDGRGDHLLEGLEQLKLLKPDGTYHVDVFKLPHHGSARNVTLELFERITADTYLVCADGKHDNPDFQTLEWLVQAAAKQGRSFKIIAANATAATDALVKKYAPQKFSYQLVVIQPGTHSITLDLSGPSNKGSAALLTIKGVGQVFAERLLQAGISTPAHVRQLQPQRLAAILKTGVNRAKKIIEAARSGRNG